MKYTAKGEYSLILLNKNLELDFLLKPRIEVF